MMPSTPQMMALATCSARAMPPLASRVTASRIWCSTSLRWVRRIRSLRWTVAGVSQSPGLFSGHQADHPRPGRRQGRHPVRGPEVAVAP